MIQTTFTKQKRELAKATGLLEKIRAHEVRKVTYGGEGEKLTEVRETYVDTPPEEIAGRVLEIVAGVVGQHAARQRANSRNTGRFSWRGVTADLTVPQLRALHEAVGVLTELANRLPRRNPKLIPNATIDGRPAFAHPPHHQYVTKTRYVPYEEKGDTRVRTYEERFEQLEQVTQTIEIDFGIDVRRVEAFRELVTDLGTAVQVAIDEANAKGCEPDPGMNALIDQIRGVLQAALPTAAAPAATAAGRREFL